MGGEVADGAADYERVLGLTIAVVPEGAVAGQEVPVKLANGYAATYIVPDGAKPGHMLPIRQLTPDVDNMTVEIHKESENTVLGIAMKGFRQKSGPYIFELDPNGLGAKVLKAGDEVVHLRGVTKTSSFNETLIGRAWLLPA